VPFAINGMMTLPSSQGEEPTVMDKSSIKCSTKNIEQAGRGYIAFCKRAEKRAQNGALEDEEEETKIEEIEEEDEGEKNSEIDAKRKKKTKAEIEREALEGDLYGLLELETKHQSTVDQIRKAYRAATLKYHPDKYS